MYLFSLLRSSNKNNKKIGINKYHKKISVIFLSSLCSVPAALAENTTIPVAQGATVDNIQGTINTNVAELVSSQVVNSAGNVISKTLDINHKTDVSILNWQSFNIGSSATVNANMPSSSSRSLYRIHQLSPSQINGALNSNGNIMLMNQNGIVFNKGAQINVGGLTASALNISDDVFRNGILTAIDLEQAALVDQIGTKYIGITPDGGSEITTYLVDENNIPVLDENGNLIPMVGNKTGRLFQNEDGTINFNSGVEVKDLNGNPVSSTDGTILNTKKYKSEKVLRQILNEGSVIDTNGSDKYLVDVNGDIKLDQNLKPIESVTDINGKLIVTIDGEPIKDDGSNIIRDEYGNPIANKDGSLISSIEVKKVEAKKINRSVILDQNNNPLLNENGEVIQIQIVDEQIQFVDVNGEVISDPTSIRDINNNQIIDSNGDLVSGLSAKEDYTVAVNGGNGGRIIFAAPNVTNNGIISAEDGQVILIAGDKAYLQASADASLRGLLVEVDLKDYRENNLNPSDYNTINNNGVIETKRGNTTVVGHSINQNGRITATTSNNANGSIRLLARGNTNITNTGGVISIDTTQTGNVTFDEDSITHIIADLESDKNISELIEKRETEVAKEVSKLKSQLAADLTQEERETKEKQIDDQYFVKIDENGEAKFSAEGIDRHLATLEKKKERSLDVQYDDGTTEEIETQLNFKSTVEVMGQKVHLKEKSRIVANGGEVNITLTDNPEADNTNNGFTLDRNDDVVFQMEEGSVIDVSGNSTQVEMERNNLVVELRGNELKDLPLQKDGVLRSEKVSLDLRRIDDFEMGDISGALGTVGRNVAERSSEGGTVTINSKGDIRLLEGSEINVSGGQVEFQEGVIETTILLDNGGNSVDIHDADPNQIYSKILSKDKDEEFSYIEAKKAGTVQLLAKGIVADGKLKGDTAIDRNADNQSVLSRYQRELSSRPMGGQLIVGNINSFNNAGFDYQAPNVVIQENNFSETFGEFRPGINDALSSEESLGNVKDTLYLSTDFITEGKFNRVNINSNGNVTLAEGNDLVINPGGEFRLKGESVNVNRNVQSLGGILEFSSRFVDNVVDVSNKNIGTFIKENITLDVSGNWTNDNTVITGTGDPKNVVVLDAGKILIKSADSSQSENINSEINIGGIIDENNTASFLDLTIDNNNDGVPDNDLNQDGIADFDLDQDGIHDVLGGNVKLLALGGARRKSDGTHEYGKGGDVEISLNNENSKLHIDKNLHLLGYGFNGGGKLSIKTNGIEVKDLSVQEWLKGQSVENGDSTVIADFLFSDTGFSEFDIISNKGDFVIDSSALIESRTPSLFLPANSSAVSSGSISKVLNSIFSYPKLLKYRNSGLTSGYINSLATLGGVIPSNSVVGFDPLYLREGQKINFSISKDPDVTSAASQSDLVFEDGALIYGDFNGAINFNNDTGGLIDFGGRIFAPGTDVTINLQRDAKQLFDQSSAIVFGDNSIIDVSGTSISVPSDNRLLSRGKVIDAGNVSVSSSGYIITLGEKYDSDGNKISNGSVIDVSGKNGVFDVTGGVSSLTTARKTLSSKAGNISFKSGEGIIDDGKQNLAAANDKAYGGSISYEINSNLRPVNTETGGVRASFDGFNSERRIEISKLSQRQLKASGDNTSEGIEYSVGEIIDPTLNGRIVLSEQKLNSNGSEQLKLSAISQGLTDGVGVIAFNGDISLNQKRDIVLDVAQIDSFDESGISLNGGAISLNANYVSIGSTIRGRENGDLDPVTGSGELNVNANLIDIVGINTLRGIGIVNLTSGNEVRVRGVGDDVVGQLAMRGALNIVADQLYPSTQTEFLIDTGTNGQINISGGDASSVALTAGGELTFKTGDLNIGLVDPNTGSVNPGVVRAPGGKLIFQTENSINLSKDSEVSVSTDGLTVFLGQTRIGDEGQEWVYSDSVNDQGQIVQPTVLYSASKQQDKPEKRIVFESDEVNIAEDGTVDLTGGGEVITYEFIPGPGGSKDFLLADNSENRFAVLPLIGDSSPYDSLEFSRWDLAAGESVYLGASSGLPEGEYLKLPARYALLPGAFLIEKVDGFENLPINQSVGFNSGTLVAGYETIKGTNIQESTTSGYVVFPGSYANTLSEFDINNSDEVVTEIAAINDLNQPRLNQDAGTLDIIAGSGIQLDGNILASAENGRRALVNIVADAINIENTKQGVADAVELLVSSLNGLGAESILIGGTRDITSEGTELTVSSNNVTIGENVELNGNEIIIAAKNNLIVSTGSEISSSGTSSNAKETLIIKDGSGDSAIVRVSADPQVDLQRNNINPNSTTVLDLQAGSTIAADNSITIDSTGNFNLEADLDITEGGSIQLGGPGINIGEVSPSATGLVLDNNKLADLVNTDLTLRTDGNITFFGTTTMTQNNLEFIGNGLIADQSNTANVTLKADRLTFSNSIGSTRLGDPLTSTGTLNIDTNQLNIGEGEFSLVGFKEVTGTVNGDIVGQGRNAVLDVRGDFDIDAARITALSGSNSKIVASGKLDIGNATAQAVANSIADIGGSFGLQGSSVTLDTFLNLPVGRTELVATNGDVILKDNAGIDVSGTSIDVLGIKEINLPGGQIRIVSNSGNIFAAQSNTNAVGLNLESGGVGASAGRLELVAQNGDVTINSNLKADQRGENADELGGYIKVDSKTIGQGIFQKEEMDVDGNIIKEESILIDSSVTNGFNQLNDNLNTAGFTGSRDIRLLEGDINVAANEKIISNQIKLTAEGIDGNGNIIIDGELLTTDKTNGGQIDLIARNDVTLNSQASLDTTTKNSAADGKISLQSTEGNLNLLAGSTVNSGSDGEVLLRVQRTNDNTDVNITEINSTITSKETIVEAVKVYDSQSIINNSFMTTAISEANDFIAAATDINNAAIESFIERVDGAVFNLRAGIEARNQGDITVTEDIDFSTFRFNDQPGIFTARATGNINIDGNLSDGVTTQSTIIPGPFGTTTTIDVFSLTENSWDLNLVAGAELQNNNFVADIFAIEEPSINSISGLANTGNIILSNDSIIRTGTGDINLYASGDIKLTAQNAIYSLGKSIGKELDNRAVNEPSLEVEKWVPVEGGDVNLVAGNNIIGTTSATDKTQLFSEWLVRQEKLDELRNPFTGTVSNVDEDAGTWIDFANFKQGVAALGGGNVTVKAGQDIERLSVSAPTLLTRDYDTDAITRLNKGNIDVHAGGDIKGGIFFVGDGVADITAVGDITAREGTTLDTMLALMGGSLNLQAGGNIDIQHIYNPTAVSFDGQPLFFTYTNDTSVKLTSLTGDVRLDGSFTDLNNFNTSLSRGTSNSDLIRYLPGELNITAAKGDINIDNGINLISDNDGGIELFAGNNIFTSGVIDVLEIPLLNIPYLETFAKSTETTKLLRLDDLLEQRSDPPLHINDFMPSYIVAETGNIEAKSGAGGIVRVRESIRIDAGNDIISLQLQGNNMRDSDITRVRAGRDIKLNDSRNIIGVGGSGRVEVIAGRNIDLGSSKGIETQGNLSNTFLSENGADLFVLAGVGEGPRYFDFYNEYFFKNSTSTDAENGVYSDDLISFLNNRFTKKDADGKDLLDRDGNKITDDIAVANFQALSREEQWDIIGEEFIPNIFSAYYSEFSAAGFESNTTGSFARGFKAIDVLFPESKFERAEVYDPAKLSFTNDAEKQAYFDNLVAQSDYQGDLTMYSSKAYTLDGGSINIVVPGGEVNAGLPVTLDGDEDRLLGVVAQSTGSILTYSREDFLVNQSRVSTLLGGDILMWSSIGNIDAGKGSKSAISAPEPLVSINDQGEVIVDISNTVSGSGIRAVVIDPEVTAGSVTLLAPNGVIDAGDAGIEASGDISIFGTLINPGNIDGGSVNVNGASLGGGATSTSGLSGTSNVANDATNSAAESATDDSEQNEEEVVEQAPQLSFISVEILGFGYDDIEEEEDEDEEEENAEVSYIKPENTEDLG